MVADMDMGLLAGTGAIVLFLLVLVVLLAEGGNRSMALRGLRRRGRTGWLTITALAVGTAVIMSSLAVGDALRGFVVEKANANLSGVDVLVLSSDFFDTGIVQELEAMPVAREYCDGIGPAMVLPVVLHNQISGRTVSRANLYGLPSDLDDDLGRFHWSKGQDGDKLQDGGLYLNRKAADELEAYRDQPITIRLDDPSIKKETIFTDAGVEKVELEVRQMVEDEGLGRLQFSVQEVRPTAFMTLDTISEALDLDNRSNAILISLKDGKDAEDAVDEIKGALDIILGAGDMHLDIEDLGEDGLRVTSDKVFFGEEVLGALQGAQGVYDSRVSTYFVDSISAVGPAPKGVSYSTVTGLDPEEDASFGLFTEDRTGRTITGELGPDQIGLTNWTALALDVDVGDEVVVGYSLIDDHFNMVGHERTFIVAWVVEMEGKGNDSSLRPSYPGIEDVGSCFDWDPPFEVDWDSIEEEDETYWRLYKGTPKAFIHIDTAGEMWGNDQGNYTLLKVMGLTQDELHQGLDLIATTEEVGMVVVPIKDQLVASASAMDIFLEMFIAFGTITIIAGMVFVASTFTMMIRERQKEIGAMMSVGISRGRLFQYLLAEGTVYSLIGGVIGLLIGWIAAVGLVTGLNTIWSGTLGGQRLALQMLSPTVVGPGTIMLSLGAGLLLSLFTLIPLAWKASSMSVMEARGLGEDISKDKARKVVRYLLLLIGVMVLASAFFLNVQDMFWFLCIKGIVLIFWSGTVSRSLTSLSETARTRALDRYIVFALVALVFSIVGAWRSFIDLPFSVLGLFVTEGLFITISLFAVLVLILWRVPWSSGSTSSTLALSFMRKEGSKTVMSVAVFALIIFSIVSLSVMIEVQTTALDAMAEGQGGGFDIMAEATSPMELDLRTEASRAAAGVDLTVQADIIQLKTVGTSGAVCSNLNPQYPPRLIGVDDEFVHKNGFELDLTLSGKEGEEAWAGLEELEDGRVPIFVDENTLIIYMGYDAYMGALGHVFEVEGDSGTWELVVAGIISPSVIAGSFIMHERYLDGIHPTASGYRLLFIGTDHPGRVVKELERELEDYGLDARKVEDIVRENTEAEQGYMGLFQAYLGAGLMIGVMAMAVTEARSVEERRREIAMLRAVGIGRKAIAAIFYTEAGIVGVLSIATGVISGLVLALVSGPVWGGTTGISVPYLFLTVFSIGLFVILLLSTAVPASRASRLSPASILKDE